MLALRLLWRQRWLPELQIVLGALVIAVSLVATIDVLTSRLERSLIQESHQLLGADKVIRRSSPVPEVWQQQAITAGVTQTLSTHFASMVFSQNNMHLASIQAVAEGYPLRGEIAVSDQPFATAEDWYTAKGIPAGGEVWAESRLLPLLGVALGDTIDIGERPLQITKILVSAPGGGGFASLFGARILMNHDDLASTNVVLPGSRINYQWLLSASDPERLDPFIDSLEPKLSIHDQVVDPSRSQRGLESALSTARRFLLLAATIGVLLAGTALAVAARRFSRRQQTQVSLLKTLGLTRRHILQLYILQFVLLAIVGIAVGLILGYGFQNLLIQTLSHFFPVDWVAPKTTDFAGAIWVGGLSLLGFCLPAVWQLADVPAMAILRQQPFSRKSVGSVVAIGGLTVMGLVAGLTQNVGITVSFLVGLVLLVILVTGLSWLLLNAAWRLGAQRWLITRLVWSNLLRHRARTLIQIMAFATVLMLVLSLSGIRTALVDDWQAQLNDSTPNHFLMNIAPHEREGLLRWFDANQIVAEPLFPMVRGRLIAIRGDAPTESERQAEDELRRELNLSWSSSLPQSNQLVAGEWWGQQPAGNLPRVSVESGLAERLNLHLGDRLDFSVGGLTFAAVISSIRSLEWDSMRPNFYFLFEPGVLDVYSPSYLTSFVLQPENKQRLNDLLQLFPTIVVIEVDRILQQIRSIIEQVSLGVEWVLVLIFAAAILVLLATVYTSFDERRTETALLRVMGVLQRRLLWMLGLEFLVCGLCAGLMAAIASECLLLAIEYWVLDLPLGWHPSLWLQGLFAGGLLVSLFGVLSCYRVINTPPAQILREQA